VKQFHALPPGNSIPLYPPVEDPTTESYILGQTPAYERHSDAEIYGHPPSQLDEGLTSVDAVGEQRYLVQKMGGGTWCELIKRNRKIEVQFQCDPSGGDRIAWIQEISTCNYLLVIHTPKLCNDLAFVPVKRVGEGEGVHEIVCHRLVRDVHHSDGGQQVLELPPDDAIHVDPTGSETPTDEDESEEDLKKSGPADYLEFVIPPASLPKALQLLKETIAQQIKERKFLRPDGIPYHPNDEEPVEYRVELIDDAENQVFGVLKVKVEKGGKIEAEILKEKGSVKLPESLRKYLIDWVEGKVRGRPDDGQADEG
jgi:hypothetical protein